MDIRVSLRQDEDGRWSAAVPDGQGVPSLLARGPSQEEALARIRLSLEPSIRDQEAKESVTLVVEVTPRLAGVAEAAQVMEWDKRRVITYIDRGRFPAPLQTLASGRVWARQDLEEFAIAWRARQGGRKARRQSHPGYH